MLTPFLQPNKYGSLDEACFLNSAYVNFVLSFLVLLGLSLLSTKKADDKIFLCKFSKNVRLFHTENSKTRGQTV